MRMYFMICGVVFNVMIAIGILYAVIASIVTWMRNEKEARVFHETRRESRQLRNDLKAACAQADGKSADDRQRP